MTGPNENDCELQTEVGRRGVFSVGERLRYQLPREAFRQQWWSVRAGGHSDRNDPQRWLAGQRQCVLPRRHGGRCRRRERELRGSQRHPCSCHSCSCGSHRSCCSLRKHAGHAEVVGQQRRCRLQGEAVEFQQWFIHADRHACGELLCRHLAQQRHQLLLRRFRRHAIGERASTRHRAARQRSPPAPVRRVATCSMTCVTHWASPRRWSAQIARALNEFILHPCTHFATFR
jgi:hypothetical protein